MRSHPSNLLRSLSLSALNQIVSSGTNFFLGIYLIRILSLSEFGFYTICFSASLLCVGLGNALIFTPMVVNTPTKNILEKPVYAAEMLQITGVLILLLIFAAALATSLSYITALPHVYTELGSATASTSAAFLLKEFVVRQAYIKRKEGIAFKLNAITASLLSLCMITLNRNLIEISAATVLHIYSLSIYLAIYFCQDSIDVCPHKFSNNIRSILKTSWNDGRWSLAGAIVTWIQTQAYSYVILAVSGPAGTGLANTAKIMISPFPFFVTAINQVSIQRLATLRISNQAQMFNWGLRLAAGMTSLSLVYFFFILEFGDLVASTLIGKTLDENLKLVTIAWCCSLVVQMLVSGGALQLQVLKRFRAITIANAASATCSIGSAILLFNYYGIFGAVLGGVIGDTILAILLWTLILQEQRKI